jgi:membrane-bound lytic murein transglycosylase D
MRRARSTACAAVCALLLAGCQHVSGPVRPGDRDATQSPPGAQAQHRLERSLDADARPALALTDDPSSEPSGDDFVDLFERMRAGFALPPVEDLRVQREIDWYVAHTAYLDRTFGRGRRYLHHIVMQLEERNMPCELALLPVVESAFDPFAHSPRLASGLWQFIPSTGRRYGLGESWWLDGRRDVLAATRAALDHLEELHHEFDGDWLLALAAYNAGAGSVRRAVERNLQTGRPTDFFHLDLQPETRSYVPRLLAIARVTAEPERFGIDFPSIPNAPYFERVDIGGQVDLGLVANLAAIPLDELRALNPQYKHWVTAPDGPYELLVPAPAQQRFHEVLATLPPSKRLRFVRHRVRRGDTLIAIANRYRVPLEALRDVNRLRGSLIHPGQELLVLLPSDATAAARPTSARRRGGLES